MRRGFVVGALLSVLSILSVPSSFAGPGRPAADPEVPRLLAEALRTGTVDADSWSRIARWVLSEREETVAAGFAQALAGVRLAKDGPDARRWDATTRAVLRAFEGVLRDAQDHRGRNGDDIAMDLLAVAGPVVAAALQEARPAARQEALAAVTAMAPPAEMVGPLTVALRNPDASVRQGAATVLGAMGPTARAAVPDLTKALEDADPAVRDAAGKALKRVRPE